MVTYCKIVYVWLWDSDILCLFYYTYGYCNDKILAKVYVCQSLKEEMQQFWVFFSVDLHPMCYNCCGRACSQEKTYEICAAQLSFLGCLSCLEGQDVLISECD